MVVGARVDGAIVAPQVMTILPGEAGIQAPEVMQKPEGEPVQFKVVYMVKSPDPAQSMKKDRPRLGTGKQTIGVGA